MMMSMQSIVLVPAGSVYGCASVYGCEIEFQFRKRALESAVFVNGRLQAPLYLSNWKGHEKRVMRMSLAMHGYSYNAEYRMVLVHWSCKIPPHKAIPQVHAGAFAQ